MVKNYRFDEKMLQSAKHIAEHIYLKEMIDEAPKAGNGEDNQDDFLRIMKKTSLY